MAELGNIIDYRWLVSSDAERWLERAAEADQTPESLLKTTIALRGDLGTQRTHLVIAQIQLRRRARKKFRHADRMFFTRQLLEQSTEERIGDYKAARFPQQGPLLDLCCGIGGDLISLGLRATTQGVDRDEVATTLAMANCQVLDLKSTSVLVDDAAQVSVDDFAAWHLDPDRRPEGHRSTKLTLHEPDLSSMEHLLASNPQAAIKLASATAVPDSWKAEAELEWISTRGECRQQVAWFGDLARTPGQRAATVVFDGSVDACTLIGDPNLVTPTASQVGRYVFEPNAAVLAASLTGQLAMETELQAISANIPYLTGDQPLDSPLLAGFEVTETMPFTIRRVRQYLRKQGIGRLEVKKRGVRLTPEHVLAELSPTGDRAATLLLMPIDKKVLAIICQRL
jgi:hypothetical protein